MRMGRNGRTDLPRGSTERSPPLSRTVFSLGRPLTGHNWAAPLLLIDRIPFRCLLILALLLISGNVHPNPGPICNHPHPRYPCSICHLDVGRDSLQCSACLKWVHFLCSSLTHADFRTICATGTAVGWQCPVGWAEKIFFLKLKKWPLSKVGKSLETYNFIEIFVLLPLVVDQQKI